MKQKILFFLLLLYQIPHLSMRPTFGSSLLYIQSGEVRFQSYAPLEVIEAASTQLKGVIDIANNEFAFSVQIASFDGFNSPLQREHFNENYMESDTYASATYSGKIIEKIKWEKDGEYIVRTKGKLTIHGVTNERIIKNTVLIADDRISIASDFSVLLSEHNISIPKIVQQKIAEEINVYVTGEFQYEQQ